MMQFEELKQSIIDNVLMPAEQGQYVTIGNQRQRESADKINEMRQVTVYFSEGDFPKDAGASYGEVMHDVTFVVELTVVSAAEVDLNTLKDSAKTADQKAAALRAMSDASVIADASMDELIRIVRDVLMDLRNANMKLETPGSFSNRWVSDIRKDTPVPDGEYVTLTASMRLTGRVPEQVPGEDLPAAAAQIMDTTIDQVGDDIEKAGVEVTTAT